MRARRGSIAGVGLVLLAAWIQGTIAPAAGRADASKGAGAVPYSPLVWRDAEWYGSAFWTGPNWTRIGRDWHHPGESTPTALRFEAPRDGRLVVTGRVFKLHLGGDGIRAMIRHNRSEVWRTEIDGTNGDGAAHELLLDVKKGDAIRFVIHKRGSIGCDTTGWDPNVGYAGEALVQASETFNSKAQGAGGWFYEMEGEPQPPAPAPVTAAADRPVAPVAADLKAALTRLAPALAPDTDAELLELALEEWWREDLLDDSIPSYRAAASNHLDRLSRILSRRAGDARRIDDDIAEGEPDTVEAWRFRYIQIRLAKRAALLSDPRMNFGELLVCKRRMPSYGHLVAQYYGWRQRGGGGLHAVRRPGYSMETRDIVGDRLPMGSILEPRLSYDGRRVLFAFVECDLDTPDPASLEVNEEGGPEQYFHLHEIGVDGSGLRRLTDGPYDDMMAEYLPDGDIVFCSTRRKGYSRCFGPQYSRRWDTYTLHRARGDGSGIRILSVNDVSEWFPAVSHSGHILFARWDYIDRDAVTHQNLWSCRPDGTNPMAVWGNGLPSPHCTFQAKPVPDSRKFVFIASAHHAITAGPVCLLDPAIGLNAPEAVERITPLLFPEAERGTLNEWYESPWPLSEDLFITAYSPHRLRMEGEHKTSPNPDDGLRICLLDRDGNRELLYRDREIGTTTPIPIAVRPTPPIVASLLREDPPPYGEMTIADVYEGLPGVPRGSIREIRIVQLFPKTTPWANQPRIGLAGEENTRAILGTVPVESDGSARFRLPAMTKVLFQALDGDGFARRTMRSSTYVQPGELTSCLGCHEYGTTVAHSPGGYPSALKRPASEIDPGELGGRPFSFVEVVQPVLDRHCIACHGGVEPKGGMDLTRAPKDGFTRSYWSLCGDTRDTWRERRFRPELDAGDLIPRYWQRNQIQITPVDDIRAARQSRFMRMLLDAPGHHDVKLDAAEIRRLAAWIDLNSIFYGAYEPELQAAQLRGERIPMPDVQ